MAKQAAETSKRKAPPKAKAKLPKGFKRRKSILGSEAHMLVATTSAFMGPPPFICVPTGPPPYPCLRYGRDPKTGQYNIPPWGEPVDCATCRGEK
jgi:hypothetical protein